MYPNERTNEMSRRATIHDLPGHVLAHRVAAHLSAADAARLMQAAGRVHRGDLGHVMNTKKKEPIVKLTEEIVDAVRTAEAHPDVHVPDHKIETPAYIMGGTLTFNVSSHRNPRSTYTLMDFSATHRTPSRAIGIHKTFVAVVIENSVMTIYPYPPEKWSKKAEDLTMTALRHAANILKLHVVVEGR